MTKVAARRVRVLIERIEDEIDTRAGKKILARVRRGQEKTIPYEKVRKDLRL